MSRRGNQIMQFHVAWEEAMRLNQHVELSCAFCNYRTKGELYFARRGHQNHRATEHPEAVSKRRQRKGKGPGMVSYKSLDENIANARTQGASSGDATA